MGSKDNLTWIFRAIEVSSRLWTSSIVGRRSYENTEKLLNDVIQRSTFTAPPLVTSDGFKYYGHVVLRLLGHACVCGQVIKTRRNNRVIKVERKPVVGSEQRLQEALARSEDSTKLNTSFVERLNLTIRQACAYLSRRALSHVRASFRLAGDIDLVRCWYNFMRPHRGLKLGKEVRTPAMQAGVVSKKLGWRDIFTSNGGVGAAPHGPRDPVSFAVI